MYKTSATDQELINRIRQGDRQALEVVYKSNRQPIQRYVLHNHGTLQDAQDLYQEVILALHRNIVEGKLDTLTSKLSTYLFQIAQNKWRNQLRIQKNMHSIDPIGDESFNEDERNTIQEDAFLQRLIGRLDERCRQILLLFYFDQLSMQEVAQQVGLSDGESAKKRKYDCLIKLKKLADRYKETDYDAE